VLAGAASGTSFISLEMFLAKTEGLEGKQQQQHGFQSHEGACATDSSGSGLCLTKLFLLSDCTPVKLEVPNPEMSCKN